MISKFGRAIAAIALPLVLLLSACGATPSTAPPPDTGATTEVSQPAASQPAPDATAPAVPDEIAGTQPVAGGQFNQFFPAPEGEFDRVFSQEKSGFAEAKLKRDGADVAMLSINDLAANPSALKKYQDSDLAIAGYPASERGSQTAILVASRYQVKVQSRSEDFSAGDRAEWIEKFDLSGLSGLK